jgi:hypothetical protein
MKHQGKPHFLGMAASLAILLHLLIFIAVRPSAGRSQICPKVPQTCYLATTRPAKGADIRVAGSPVLFSLPSRMGFSSTLLRTRLRTKLDLKQRKEPETFLKVSTVQPEGSPEKLMLTAGGNRALGPPILPFQPSEKSISAQRIQISPKLKERLEGNIVLPPELNQAPSAAWQVQAEVGISTQGEILHIFLDHPLESETLNQQVLQLLHNLRFKPGNSPTEGHIELYSPEPTAGATP